MNEQKKVKHENIKALVNGSTYAAMREVEDECLSLIKGMVSESGDGKTIYLHYSHKSKMEKLVCIHRVYAALEELENCKYKIKEVLSL